MGSSIGIRILYSTDQLHRYIIIFQGLVASTKIYRRLEARSIHYHRSLIRVLCTVPAFPVIRPAPVECKRRRSGGIASALLSRYLSHNNQGIAVLESGVHVKP